jgi:SAM-dependent methyltransferase
MNPPLPPDAGASCPWEARYRAAETPWDKGEPSPGLVEFLRRHGPLAGRVLVPGCGFGHDVRAISCPGNEVVGLDIAPSAVRVAGAFPKTAGERYVAGDLFHLPAGWAGTFDWVWEHTCFCAIDPDRRPDYAAAVRSALRTGGHLLGVFYMEPDHDGDGPPYGVTAAELDDLFGGRFVAEEDWLPSRTFTTRVGRERMRLLRAV